MAERHAFSVASWAGLNLAAVNLAAVNLAGVNLAGLAAVLCCMVATDAATARIQDYQIERLLSYKTQCNATRLEDRSPKTGPMRFVVECENKTFYPDGIEISCADRDDDRSCVLLTKQKAFDQLHLLDRNGQ